MSLDDGVTPKQEKNKQTKNKQNKTKQKRKSI